MQRVNTSVTLATKLACLFQQRKHNMYVSYNTVENSENNNNDILASL